MKERNGTDEAKKALRGKMTRIREAIPAEERLRADERRGKYLTGMTEYRGAKAVLTYVSARGEADTRKIIREALKEGKTVAVPKVRGREMRFYVIGSEAELETGAFGIPEPREGCAEFDVKDGNPDDILFLVPGLAFDERGGRLGYGGGYYDRFLAGHPGLERIALAFEAQIVAEPIPTGEGDIPVDRIVTERGIYVIRD